jgi:hypothetical protein
LFEVRLLGIKKQVEVLNASAASWGIGNQLGYIRKFGTFESEVVMKANWYSRFATTSKQQRAGGKSPGDAESQTVIGNSRSVSNIYVRPKLSSIFVLNSPVAGVPVSESQRFMENRQRFEQIVALVRAKNIPLFVLYTCDRADLLPVPNQPKFKSDRLKALKVPVIDTHAAWSKLPKTRVESYFRDGVHPTAPAYESIADLVFQQLCIQKKLVACGGKK